MKIDTARMDSPIGPLAIAAGPGGICAVDLGADLSRLRRAVGARAGGVEWREGRDAGGAVRALTSYFEGRLDALDSLPVDPSGTPFQRRVWLALRDIAAGTTWSYSRLARVIGSPEAVRAVGAANGANPLPLILPCHRVIGADGSLTGYGGGLDRKAWLLRHEGAMPAHRPGRSAPLPLFERG